jgi:hypothetical protein
VRNILNFTNIIRVFQGNNDIVNQVEFSADSGLSATSLRTEAEGNEAYDAETGDIDLRFDGAGISGCSGWVNAGNTPSAPNCVYLARAEQRFGNGDGLYTAAEQQRAFNSYYGSFRGRNFFTDAPRRMRLGLEVNF